MNWIKINVKQKKKKGKAIKMKVEFINSTNYYYLICSPFFISAEVSSNTTCPSLL